MLGTGLSYIESPVGELFVNRIGAMLLGGLLARDQKDAELVTLEIAHSRPLVAVFVVFADDDRPEGGQSPHLGLTILYMDI
jgi:hypothetical protein